jgi:phosphoadenosine phosphosulfate reductase
MSKIILENLAHKLEQLSGKEQLLALRDFLQETENNNQLKATLLSAFNPEDILLSDFLRELNFPLPIFFLDTKKHFPETLRYVDEIKSRCEIQDLRVLTPDEQQLNRLDPEGNMWQSQVNRCCYLRKVAPLEAALQQGGFNILITGRRGDQTPERQNIGTIEWDEKGRLKLNPLIHMQKNERDENLKLRHLPLHPLYNLGYPSIGCAPCTTPVFAGEDDRAGRWRHTRLNDHQQKTECGLHVAIKEAE